MQRKGRSIGGWEAEGDLFVAEVWVDLGECSSGGDLSDEDIQLNKAKISRSDARLSNVAVPTF